MSNISSRVCHWNTTAHTAYGGNSSNQVFIEICSEYATVQLYYTLKTNIYVVHNYVSYLKWIHVINHVNM